MREGWQVYLHNLRLYLTHFAGQRCSWIMVLGNAPEPQDRAWAKFAGALGLGDPAEGERAAATAPGVPALAGVTEWVGRGEPHHGLMLRVDDPAPGFALVFVYEYRGLINTSLHAYLFGDEAPAVAARDEPVWRAWMKEHFPSATTASETSATTT